MRALRRRELFRLACADILSRAGELAPAQPLDVDAIGIALSDVTDATLGAALHAARRVAPRPRRGCASRSSAWAGSAGTR